MMDINEIIKPENKVYGKTPILKDNILHYCPGCSHGVVHKIIAEVIEEMGIQDKTIGYLPCRMLRIRIQLSGHRLAAGSPRTCSRPRHSHQETDARQIRVHIPG